MTRRGADDEGDGADETARGDGLTLRGGIHLRYTGDDVVAVEGVGVFQRGTVAWAPRDKALALLRDGRFEPVSDGPSAQAFVVRIGPAAPPEETPRPARERKAQLPPPRTQHAAPDEPAPFERELEELERAWSESEAARPDGGHDHADSIDGDSPGEGSPDPARGTAARGPLPATKR